jgi:hypothetical protein
MVAALAILVEIKIRTMNNFAILDMFIIHDDISYFIIPYLTGRNDSFALDLG